MNENCIYRNEKEERAVLPLSEETDLLMLQGRLLYEEREKKRKDELEKYSKVARAIEDIQFKVQRAKL